MLWGRQQELKPVFSGTIKCACTGRNTSDWIKFIQPVSWNNHFLALLQNHELTSTPDFETFHCFGTRLLLYFIVICVNLYLIKSHNSVLSITSLNSSYYKGTLSFISATRSSSFTWLLRFVYAVKVEKRCRMVRICGRNDIGILNIVLAYIANQPIVRFSLNERVSLRPRKAFRVRISYALNVNQIKI